MDRTTELAAAFNMISALARELSDVQARLALDDRRWLNRSVLNGNLATRAGAIADELSQDMPWPNADEAAA